MTDEKDEKKPTKTEIVLEPVPPPPYKEGTPNPGTSPDEE